MLVAINITGIVRFSTANAVFLCVQVGLMQRTQQLHHQQVNFLYMDSRFYR